jgi:hypothetical protein
VPSPSSSKKIERVQRAGAKRSAGAPRPIGFPLAVMAILLVGSLAVFFARQSRIDAQNEQPVVNARWRVAFGVYHCDRWANEVTNDPGQATTTGIQWGDGYISVSPSGPESAGDKATFGKFLERVGIEISDGDDGPVATLPDGVLASGNKLESGSDCAINEGEDEGTTKKAELVLLRWPPKSSEKTEPQVIRSGFEKVRFTEDREIFALALVPVDLEKDEYPFPTQSVTAMQSAMTGVTTTTEAESQTSEAPTTEAPTTTAAESSDDATEDTVLTTVAPGPTTTAANGEG